MIAKRKTLMTISMMVILLLALSACGVLPSAGVLPQQQGNPVLSENIQPAKVLEKPAVADAGQLAAYEGTLEQVYADVNPSVVSITVTANVTSDTSTLPLPGFQVPGGQQEGQGSGFVWDTQGHIVTNNHVVEGATDITVTFSDGSTAEAKLVGADPDSDLAVIKVDLPADQLKPVVLTDSDAVKVGQLAIAIGNPYGLQNTMTVGIISALGRTLPVESGTSAGFSIPNVIQTDAAINPGNSGGVLLNSNGEVVGVPTAITSTSRSNSGIGYVVPSNTVSQVVPVLIEGGKFEHSWLGISGGTLNANLIEALKLPSDQRGVLVAEVVDGSPASKAGLKAAQGEVQINGTAYPTSGDVITAINGQVVEKMEDLISYLGSNTSVGDKISLTVLRDGKQLALDVTLAARPTQ